MDQLGILTITSSLLHVSLESHYMNVTNILWRGEIARNLSFTPNTFKTRYKYHTSMFQDFSDIYQACECKITYIKEIC